MTEQQALFLAVATWCGASFHWPIPVWVGLGSAAIAVAGRRPFVLVLAGFLLGNGLGAHANDAYRPIEAATFDGPFELVTDPAPVGFGLHAEVRLEDGQRVRVWAWGADVPALRDASAGTEFVGSGRLVPLTERPWLKARHLVGELRLVDAQVVGGPVWWRLPSEALRDLVARGASSLDPDQRSLYLGLVVGDDRTQSITQQSRFRLAGLSHLLAVSGQNVAFALAVAGPAIRRVGGPGRFGLVVGVLFVFAVATRFEPSVVRATMTAGCAAGATVLGRRASGLRVLALTVTGLVLVDPFLVLSVGFQLSVLASAGILVLAEPLADRVPGPRVFGEAVAITMAAQLFVMPVILLTFGPVSLISLPANLLAGWAAGVVMVWGLSVGVLAGVVSVGPWLQWPVGQLVDWIDGVAAWASRVPAPAISVDAAILASPVLLGAVVVSMLGGWRHLARPVVLGLALALMVVGGFRSDRSDSGSGSPVALTGGGRFWPATEATPSVLAVQADADRRLVASLIAAQLGPVDIVVLMNGDRSMQQLAGGLAESASPGLILAPPLHRIPGARRLTDPASIDVGENRLDIAIDGNRLRIAATGIDNP